MPQKLAFESPTAAEFGDANSSRKRLRTARSVNTWPRDLQRLLICGQVLMTFHVPGIFPSHRHKPTLFKLRWFFQMPSIELAAPLRAKCSVPSPQRLIHGYAALVWCRTNPGPIFLCTNSRRSKSTSFCTPAFFRLAIASKARWPLELHATKSPAGSQDHFCRAAYKPESIPPLHTTAKRHAIPSGRLRPSTHEQGVVS